MRSAESKSKLSFFARETLPRIPEPLRRYWEIPVLLDGKGDKKLEGLYLVYFERDRWYCVSVYAPPFRLFAAAVSNEG